MSSDAAVETPAPRRKTRWWLPLGVGVVVVAAWGGIWAYPDETLDVGSRRMFTIMSGFLGLALMLLWLWLLSGLGWKLRLGSFLLVVVVAGAAVASVRRVNFTGDMQPTFVFRWQTTGDTLLDQAQRRGSHLVLGHDHHGGVSGRSRSAEPDDDDRRGNGRERTHALRRYREARGTDTAAGGYAVVARG